MRQAFNCKGQGFIEYAFALAIIVLIVFTAFQIFSNNASSIVSNTASHVGSQAAAL